MKENIRYEMKVVREGLTQYKFEGHGYTLSVGSSDTHYASKAQGTVEIAILDEQGAFVPLSKYDSVEGYLPRSKVDDFLAVLQRTERPRSFFTNYFENRLDN